MITKTDKKEKKSGVNPFVAAVTGIIVGAGVVTAGVMSLKNKDNRKKVKKVIDKVKTTSQDYLKKTKDFINDNEIEVEVKPKKTITAKKIEKEIKK